MHLYERALDAGRFCDPVLKSGAIAASPRSTWGPPARRPAAFFFPSTTTGIRGTAAREAYFDPEHVQRGDRQGGYLQFFQTDPGGRRPGRHGGPPGLPFGNSGRQWQTPLSLVFIDGGHSYDSAAADYHGWGGHLMPGGCLLIHDIFKNPEEGGRARTKCINWRWPRAGSRSCPLVKTLVLRKRETT